MRILHDYQGTECRKRLPSARPDLSILSPPEPLISSSKTVTPSSTQSEISSSATGTSHDAPSTEHRPDCQYIAKRQYRLVYEQVGYPLHNVQSIDKAFKAIQDVLTRYLHSLNIASADQHSSSRCSVVFGQVSPQGYQYR